MNRNIFKEKDCLNTIRLLAAIQVLYGHTIYHLNIEMQPIISCIINFFSGVPIFFTLSGFLIWGSIGRSNKFSQYLKKRFWRIYPELWIAVLIELLIILALYHKPINRVQYILFAFTQGSIFQFWTPDFLREYGCGCPNGSLWTICVLIQFYFFAYFIYKVYHNKKNSIWIISIIFSVILGYLTPLFQSYMPEIIGKLYTQTLLPYLWMFLLSSYVAEKKNVIIPFLKKYWLPFLIMAFILQHSHFDIKISSYHLLHTIVLFLGLLGASYIFPQLNIKTDISYGIYIYHMTVVNALIALNYRESPLLLLFVLVITSLLAWISTKTIGRWSINMKLHI